MVLTSIIAPYRIPVFNALAECDDIELHVVYDAERSPARRWPVYREQIRHSYTVLRERRGIRRGIDTLHLSSGLLTELRRHHPDVVVAGGWDQPVHCAAFWLRHVFGYRFAWWVESTERDQRPASAIATIAKRHLTRRADALLVPGSAATRYVRALGASIERIFVAPNAVDNHLFTRAPRSPQHGSRTVRYLYVGRLTHAKGLRTLLDAWQRLPSDLDLRLTLVGEGELTSWVTGLIATRSIHGVELLGHLDPPAVAAAYARADVFVFPSHSDPWGLVLNEAMAAGLPVVTTAAPGAVDDLVRDGWNGFVVGIGDADALARAMLRLARDPELRVAMGERARSHVLEQYSPARCASGFAQLAHALAPGPRRRSAHPRPRRARGAAQHGAEAT